MEMYQRLKELRKNILKMTQQEFADSINISRSNIGNIEVGRIAMTDRIVSDICDKFDVNENWLRHGEGNPLVEKTRHEEIANFIGGVLKDEDESFKIRLISSLAALDEDEWVVLEKFAESLIKKDQ
jgi:DNA-binding XRE family transcriptional regulator